MNQSRPVIRAGSSPLHARKPTRLSAVIFAAKVMFLRNLRRWSDLKTSLHRFGPGRSSDYPVLLAQSRSPLRTAESQVETRLQLGKVQNLRKACSRLHLAAIPAGQTFSFWKQVGRARKSSGYAKGRELRQGCLIPIVGGGLCQLSNHLYDLALRCGCTVVERHAHTAVVPGSAAESGRDATVFWNYVDLRFSPKQNILITAWLSRDELILSFWGKQTMPQPKVQTVQGQPVQQVKTCTDCGVKSCFRYAPIISTKMKGKSAFLIDECWPEFNEFTNQAKATTDELFLPWHSGYFHSFPRYEWDASGHSKIIAANAITVLYAVKARLGLPAGIPPIVAQLHRSRELAKYYSKRLSPDVTNLYIAQALLPFLWRSGDLGGRNFSVFLTRWPMNLVHQELDKLAARFPQRKSLREFRAPDWMVEAEADALEHAESVITPHAFLAGMFSQKVQKLAWRMPQEDQSHRRECIVFPGPTAARKGAYEVRQSLEGTGEKLLVLGENLESDDFWRGVDLSRNDTDWVRQALLVVQPAFVENAPRPLLRALSAGIPVIATPECGIASHPNLILVPSGNVQALKKAIAEVLKAPVHLARFNTAFTA